MRQFRFNLGGNRPHDAWFRIGSLDITTSWLMVLVSIAGFVVYAVAGSSSTLELNLALWGDAPITQGKVWQFITWPFSHWQTSSVFWDALAVFFLWWFGQELEASLGKVKYLWFLIATTVALGVVMSVMFLVEPFLGGFLASASMLQLMVLLVWIAEGPNRMFMFNIPAWVFGLIIVGLQVVSMMGNGYWGQLLHLFLSLFVVALIAKGFGLLREFSFIPQMRVRRKPKLRSVPPRSNLPPTPSKWNPPPTAPLGRDEARMNELLDKILDSGQDSLSAAERAELEALRLRRRRG
ncbi:hypothetical protein BH09ACT11_BH09ACT11_18030 [soil metagenome]